MGACESMSDEGCTACSSTWYTVIEGTYALNLNIFLGITCSLHCDTTLDAGAPGAVLSLGAFAAALATGALF